MRIYVDFDDVLCETARHLLGLAREMFGCQVSYEEISVFDLQTAFALSGAELGALMRHAHRLEVLDAIEPVSGGVETIQTLLARGHGVTVVTGRPASSHAGSSAWLRRHGLGGLELVHVDKYGRAAEDAPKAGDPKPLDPDAFARLQFDVAIEDSPAALDLLVPRDACTVIVYDRPWNRKYRASGNMCRAASWHEIEEMIAGWL